MSTSTSLFPDVNVWLALAHQIHPHHPAARAWAESVEAATPVYFCRLTQLGLLRLLTNPSAMGEDVLTQAEAWEAFDAFLLNPANRMHSEPSGIDPIFRSLSSRAETSTRTWADAYLAAFAEAAGLTLVTFDRALAARAKGALLLI